MQQQETTHNDDSDDEIFSGFDCFELNIHMSEAIRSVQSIREFTRNICYVVSSGSRNSGDREISPDCWFLIFEYLPFIEFSKISLICSSFAEIITFNGRYLILRKILNDFSGFLRPTYTTFQQAVNQLSERSPMSEKYSWENELLLFYVEKRRIKDGLWEYWKDPIMNDELIIEQFRRMNKKNVGTYFDLFHKIPDHLKKDREFVVKLLKSSNYSAAFYIHLGDELKFDWELMLITVKQNGFMLKYMHDKSLPFDEEIAREALRSKFRNSFDFRNISSSFRSYQNFSLLPQTRHLVEITPELIQNEFLRTIEKRAKVNIALCIYEAYCDRLDVLEWILSISFFLTRDSGLCLSIIELIYRIEKGKPVNDIESIRNDLLNYQYSFFKVFDSEIPQWITRKIHICPQFRLHRKEFTILDIVKKLVFRSSTLFWKLLETKITNNLLDFIKSITLEIGVSSVLAHQIHMDSLIKKCIDKKYGENFIQDLVSDLECVRKMIRIYPRLYPRLFLFKEDPIIKNMSETILYRVQFPVSDEKLISLFTSNPRVFIGYFREKGKWITEMKPKLQQLLCIQDENGTILGFSPQLIQKPNPMSAISHIIGQQNYECWNLISEEEWSTILKNSKPRSFVNHFVNIQYYSGTDDFISISRKIETAATSLNKKLVLKRLILEKLKK